MSRPDIAAPTVCRQARAALLCPNPSGASGRRPDGSSLTCAANDKSGGGGDKAKGDDAGGGSPEPGPVTPQRPNAHAGIMERLRGLFV